MAADSFRDARCRQADAAVPQQLVGSRQPRARRALGQALRERHHDALVFHTQVTGLLSIEAMRRLPTVISLDATPMNYDTVGSSYGHVAAGNGPIDRQKYRMNRRAFHAAGPAS